MAFIVYVYAATANWHSVIMPTCSSTINKPGSCHLVASTRFLNIAHMSRTELTNNPAQVVP